MKSTIPRAAAGFIVSMLTAAALLLLAPPAAAQPRADPAGRWVWDLTPLYKTDADWEQERKAVLAELPALAAAKGTLGTSAATMRAALDRYSAVERRLDRLWVYASAQQSTDNRDARNQERMGLMRSLAGEVGSEMAWVDPEVQALGTAKVEAFIGAEPGLKNHTVRLREKLRLAQHTLSAETEAALAAFSPVINAAAQTRTLMVDADMEWPSVTIEGRPTKVSDTAYEKLRQNPDRALRKQVFDAFFGQLGKFENSFGSTLSAAVQAGTVEAKLRRYPSAVAASLSGYQVPESVYRTLVAQANAALPTLHRYFKLRQRLLKLPDLHYYDIYPSMIEFNQPWPLADAARVTLQATQPLGTEYQQLLGAALEARSMHVLPAEGKSGGAYQTGVYGLTPLVFLNHQDDFESVSTFAHEWGHGMHTLLANRAQPFENAGYPLFLAEIASTTNEVLLSQHMLRQSKTRAERLFQLGYELERLRGTFYRQAMFGEFELMTHDAVERGEALTGKRFTEMYCSLLRKYHGADAGVMTIDPKYCFEWAFIPHFYRPFYVYQYATSIAAASFFAEQIAAGKPGARETYLDVLRAGGSMPAYELLKSAGVDMASPAPYQALVRRMDSIIDEMERLVK